MIIKNELNEDQRISFDYMIAEGGFGEEEALALIQELCVEKSFTGLRADKFRFTPEGKRVAWELWMERMVGGELLNVFKEATKDRGFLQFILACICVAICFPIGILWGLIKGGR